MGPVIVSNGVRVGMGGYLHITVLAFEVHCVAVTALTVAARIHSPFLFLSEFFLKKSMKCYETVHSYAHMLTHPPT